MKCPKYSSVKYKQENNPYVTSSSANRVVKSYRKKGKCATKHYFKNIGYIVYHE